MSVNSKTQVLVVIVSEFQNSISGRFCARNDRSAAAHASRHEDGGPRGQARPGGDERRVAARAHDVARRQRLGERRRGARRHCHDRVDRPGRRGPRAGRRQPRGFLRLAARPVPAKLHATRWRVRGGAAVSRDATHGLVRVARRRRWRRRAARARVAADVGAARGLDAEHAAHGAARDRRNRRQGGGVRPLPVHGVGHPRAVGGAVGAADARAARVRLARAADARPRACRLRPLLPARALQPPARDARQLDAGARARRQT